MSTTDTLTGLRPSRGYVCPVAAPVCRSPRRTAGTRPDRLLATGSRVLEEGLTSAGQTAVDPRTVN